MIELAVLVVEAEQQRADFGAVALVPEAADDTVGGAQAFHFQHRADARLVGAVSAFGDDAVGGTVSRRRKPALSLGKVGREGRQYHLSRTGILLCEAFECATALGHRQVDQRHSVRRQQHVEHDEASGRGSGELSNAAFRRMEAHLQGLEREVTVDFDHQLAVDDKSLGRNLGQQGENFGKVASERFAGFRMKRDFLAIFEREAAEAIPLRFVLPAIALRQRLGGARLHG